METVKYKPDFIYRGKKPVAAIIKIKDYEQILEELEELEDIKYLKEIRKNGIETFDFEEYLVSRGIDV